MINSSTTQAGIEIKKNSRCPICQTEFLQVHETEMNEKFLMCPVCGVKFKSAPSSDHLMFVETPINFPNNLVGLWLSRAQIGKALHDYRMMSNQNGVDRQESRATVNIPTANPLRAQAVRKARSLILDGKSPDYVQKRLSEEMQLSQYAIEEIIQDALAVRKAHQKQKLLKVTYVLFALLLIIVVAYIVLMLIYS
jgi:Zn-finger nucleic acid-binding protein